MAAPFLVACLVALRTEFNLVAPHRDKGADGWIGDLAHQQEVSDHNPDETGRTPTKDADTLNEIHAIDIDKDLGSGLDLDVFVERIRRNHLAGRDDRLQNIIWRGRIASRSWGWSWRPYTGPSKHFDHAHFSSRYTTAQESDTSPWGVYVDKEDLPVKQADFNALMDGWATTQPAQDFVNSLLDTKLGRSDITVGIALQNTESETRGLGDFLNSHK
jgi:hypothetical protein